MKQIQIAILILTIFVTMFVGYLFPTIAAAEMDGFWVGKIVSVQGRVQVRRAGAAEWVSVRLNETYGFGDMIRVQEQSRAAVVLRSGAILRLDQKTTITFSASEQKEESSLLDLLHGAAHFFSPTPRKLKVTTPFVNAAVGGTEFFVRVERNQTLLSVFEGRVAAINEAGSLVLASGQSAIAWTGQAPVSQVVVRPRDAVQWALYYPPILDYQPADFPGGGETSWQAMVRKSIGFFWGGDLASAFFNLKETPDDISDPRFFTYRAALHLSVGRVDDASADIEKALNLDPYDNHAFALQSIIAVAQNRKEQALDLARKVVEFAPESSAARVALSYAQQAHFDIKSALVSLKEAANLDPENALVQARQAELQLSMGNLDEAVRAAREAVSLNPDIARTQTVLGFAYLTEIKTLDAKNAFKRAIELDQAAPLPRLGLGLARIREGDLKQGRGEIEIAASLDPDNSLIRSYLGKAYFEEKRDKSARNQLAMARELDPLDPTPWFYDAIRKQTINRPVEALQDLQKSIELNDNRAVYRSRMLLDEDLAARSASLGRIYSDLGFQQLALVEGYKSLNTDPSNYSAHRFLADSYAALPRHEIARVSELLQSQLLQPINITPVQPSFAESNLLILEGVSPANPSYNEFSTLFNSNRIALQASGVVGENTTPGNEIVLSGVWGRGSYSLGQFYYETDGFRENNDLEKDITDVFAQVNLSPKTSLQGEFRHKETKYGDRALSFDPFDPSLKTKARENTCRLGLYYAPASHSDLVASVIYQDATEEQSRDFFGFPMKVEGDTKGYIAETQYMFRKPSLNLIGGGGHYELDSSRSFIDDFDTVHDNGYLYSYIRYPSELTWTVGASFDSFDDDLIGKFDRVNPKFGMIWNLTPETTLRLAGFKVFKRTLIADQTVEPTQVAGFNQFFDDFNGTGSSRYGAAVDQRFSSSLYGGLELSNRALNVPIVTGEVVVTEDWAEELYRAYLYWTPHRSIAIKAEYQLERFERERLDEFNETPFMMKTHLLPVVLGYFHPSGFFSRLQTTYVNQKVELITGDKVDDEFVLMDVTLGYRMPKRYGIMSIKIKNLFDENFDFEGIDSRTSQTATNSPFVPERTLLISFTMAF